MTNVHLKDKLSRQLVSHNDVFADVFNALLYSGEQKVAPDELSELSERSVYQILGEIFGAERDIIREWKDGQGLRLAILGTEIQSEYDPSMPARIMLYDAAAYMWQFKKDEERRKEHRRQAISEGRKPPVEPPEKPAAVITLVLYLGEKPWGAQNSLSDCVRVNDEVKRYFSNYNIHVVDLGALPKDKLELFRRDFGVIAEFLWQKRNFKSFTAPQTSYHVSYKAELYNLLHKMAKNDAERKNILNIVMDSEEGRMTMRDYWQEGIDKAVAENEARVKAETEARVRAETEARVKAETEARDALSDKLLKQLFDKMMEAGKGVQDFAVAIIDRVKRSELFREYGIDENVAPT